MPPKVKKQKEVKVRKGNGRRDRREKKKKINSHWEGVVPAGGRGERAHGGVSERG
jgi:hypothetical protein